MHQVKRGNLLIYRQFDVADGIDLDAAQSRVQRGETRRLDLRRVPKTSVAIATPPLSFELGQQRVQIDQEDYALDGSVRVYDFGVISIALRLDIPSGTSLEALVPLNVTLSNSTAIDRLAKDLALQVSDDLKSAMLRPKFSGFGEDYTIVFVEQMTDKPAIELLRADPAMARLLLAEPTKRPIAQEAMEDATVMHFSYYADELAVVDYNSAFIYDPQGDLDIPDLIEFASAQLLEMRYYDTALDRELASMYDEVGRVRHRVGLGGRNHRALARRLLQVVLEVTELIEKIENSLKWVGDPYLAQAYQAAVTQFQLQRWQQQVESKLRLMMEVVTLLNNQSNTSRSLLLETLILILIFIEVIAAFLR